MLNYHWLRTFSTLVATGQFTRTAEQLHMTQPGVSQHIRKLENQLGQKLLERSGRKFELTEAGRTLAEFAERAARQERDLLEHIGRDDPYSGQCRIACSGSLALLLYPRFLEYQRQHPGLQVLLEATPNRRIRELIRADQMDIGITTIADKHSELSQDPIGTQQLCLTLPASARLDAPARPRLGELQALGFVEHPDGIQYAQKVLAAAYGEEFEGLQSIPRSGSINQILVAVAAGTGFTVLPESAVRSFPEREKIVTARLAHDTYEELFLVKRRRYTLPSRYRWFIDCIQQELGARNLRK
ncbi:LysR family transcriptional regulator [Microbulbifer sp. JSM ZJ756]|uniref:LysR family transcriptional regulator n=1 Tax=Microbulbifer sp. JSM ZJ756 TaxID=3376191 RepID=UPI0037964094